MSDQAEQLQEGVLRTNLSSELAEHMEFWFVARGSGNECIYITGQTQGSQSRERRAGVMELVQRGRSTRITMLEINLFKKIATGNRIVTNLSAEENPAIDTIELSLIVALAHPDHSRQVGPDAFQSVMAGEPVDFLDD